MLNKYVNEHFYYNEDGSIDEVVHALGNCLIQCSYILMKILLLARPDFIKVFLNETTLLLCISDDDDILDIRVPYNTFERKIFTINETNNKDESFENVITRILNSGSIPIISTIIERLPFSKFYIPSCDFTQKRTDHMFLVIDEDEENYYIVDNPDVINRRNVKYYNNTEIVILSKDELREASNYYCSILKLDFDYDKIYHQEKCCIYAVKDSINNYEDNFIIKEDISYFFGKNAFLKLREIIASGKLNLNDEAPSKDRELYDFFDWKIWTIKGSRELMKKYFEGIAKTTNNKAVENILIIIKNDIEQWSMFRNALIKSYFKGKYKITDRYNAYLDSIMQSEDRLILSLNMYLNGAKSV